MRASATVCACVVTLPHAAAVCRASRDGSSSSYELHRPAGCCVSEKRFCSSSETDPVTVTPLIATPTAVISAPSRLATIVRGRMFQIFCFNGTAKTLVIYGELVKVYFSDFSYLVFQTHSHIIHIPPQYILYGRR